MLKTNTVAAFAEVKTGSGSVIARSDSGQVMVSAICPSQDRMCVEIADCSSWFADGFGYWVYPHVMLEIKIMFKIIWSF